MPTAQSRLILLDNTVLSNFAVVKRTDIVLQLWNACSTTPDAWQEFQSGIELGHLPGDAWKMIALTELTDIELEIAKRLASVLGAGERSCIAVVKNRGGLFVTDDRKARQVAQDLRIKVTGTSGILIVAVERKIIPMADANHLLAKMIQNGYRAPVDNLSSLLS
jgi:predicted nucleic acid-binding protein